MAKAIGSVLSQTFKDYELIIVDDGSKDNSFTVALNAIEGHRRCHIYKQKNAGVSMARNNGVALSRGDYLCFLDADDWWSPGFLAEMSEMIGEYPEAGIYGSSYTIVNETKHKTRVAKIGVEDGFERGYVNYCQVYAKTMYMPLWTGAVCVPRTVFDEMGGFPKGIKLGEDFLLWIHIALKYKVAFSNKSFSFYNQDVDAVNRGVGKLHKPEEHMLWNLKDLEPIENLNADYKQLVDKLRVADMMPYILCKEYRDAARCELLKVDWSKQSERIIKQYQRPIAWLKIENKIRIVGSRIKTLLIRYGLR